MKSLFRCSFESDVTLSKQIVNVVRSAPTKVPLYHLFEGKVIFTSLLVSPVNSRLKDRLIDEDSKGEHQDILLINFYFPI